MISERKLIDIIEKLLARAKSDEVRWQLDQHDEDSTSFTVQFKESKFYVQYSSPPTETDYIEIGIETRGGDPIKRLVVEEDEEDPMWTLFCDLYKEAERSLMGGDRVLSEIEEELQKKGSVGLSSNSPQ